jgi:hypothetical protein
VLWLHLLAVHEGPVMGIFRVLELLELRALELLELRTLELLELEALRLLALKLEA